MSPIDHAISDDNAGKLASSPIQQTQYRAYKHHRRASSTGGGRAWTEEEEAYLLRTRMQKMPYKHIAAHLKKTELACRLHYHQMSYGNNGRRRTDSISSTVSLNSTAASQDIPLENTHHKQLSPVTPSPPRSPGIDPPDDKVSFQQPRAHVPILPKQDGRYISLPRLDTCMMQAGAYNSPETDKPVVDHSRVRALYEAHRESFWSMIAAEYSYDFRVPAHVIEHAFLQSLTLGPGRSNSPPTPRPSPAASPKPHSHSYLDSPVHHRAFQAVNSSYTSLSSSNPKMKTSSPADRCSVSSLLTEEKEVRPSRERLQTVM
ncbi:hypothetical protein PISL3812_07263 [Talaromyces islandicus]|uniref:Myb-like domain-containing protein n=1 Tax=Talaromyces islandicus TaxID=28573 RepID=A0A0U1M5B6_TALIS|nr:hypothetical protein PISL3812_07263 [Talaromyces islandicus]